jgi:hypothetical protein
MAPASNITLLFYGRKKFCILRPSRSFILPEFLQQQASHKNVLLYRKKKAVTSLD